MMWCVRFGSLSLFLSVTHIMRRCDTYLQCSFHLSVCVSLSLALSLSISLSLTHTHTYVPVIHMRVFASPKPFGMRVEGVMQA